MKFALPLLALVFTLLTGCCDAESLGNQTVTVRAATGSDTPYTEEIKINSVYQWKVLSGEGRNRKWFWSDIQVFGIASMRIMLRSQRIWIA